MAALATVRTPHPARSGWGTTLVLGAAAVVLYAPLIGWGIPYATAPDRTKTVATDEILPLEALAEMHNTFVVSKPDRNYGYPWWHYFVVASAQAPYVIFLLATGQLQGSAPEFPFGLHDPVAALQALTVIGRGVSVLMGAGTVIAAYYFSRALWGASTGVAAAVLTLLNYLMFYYSRTGNPDVPAFFWSAIGLVVFARILVHGLTLPRAVWLGVFAALAMATKDQALVLFLPLGAALLVLAVRPPASAAHPTRALLGGLAASVVVYAIATGMLVDPHRHLTHVSALLFDPGRVTAAAAYRPGHPRSWVGTMELGNDFLDAVVDAFSLPVLLTCLVGVCLIARSSPRLLVLLLPIPTLFLLLILPTRTVVVRYLLPLTLIVDAFAAHAVVRLHAGPWRGAAAPLFLFLCGWRFLLGADLSFAQYQDSRRPAGAWLQAHVRPGERLEYFGVAETLPPLPATISSRRIAGRVRWVGESGHGPALLQYLTAQGPEFLVVIPDWTSAPGMPHSADCPPEVYAALQQGTAGYEQVAYFPPPAFLSGVLRRPSLDHPSVAPPVRIFARRDVAARVRPNDGAANRPG